MSIISDTKKKFDIISFGEVMLRLSPPDKEKISQGQVPVVQNLMWHLVLLS